MVQIKINPSFDLSPVTRFIESWGKKRLEGTSEGHEGSLTGWPPEVPSSFRGSSSQTPCSRKDCTFSFVRVILQKQKQKNPRVLSKVRIKLYWYQQIHVNTQKPELRNIHLMYFYIMWNHMNMLIYLRYLTCSVELQSKCSLFPRLH